jgi:hypothetical protein
MIHFHQEYALFQDKIEHLTIMFSMFWKEALEESPGYLFIRFLLSQRAGI